MATTGRPRCGETSEFLVDAKLSQIDAELIWIDAVRVLEESLLSLKLLMRVSGPQKVWSRYIFSSHLVKWVSAPAEKIPYITCCYVLVITESQRISSAFRMKLLHAYHRCDEARGRE